MQSDPRKIAQGHAGGAQRTGEITQESPEEKQGEMVLKGRY